MIKKNIKKIIVLVIIVLILFLMLIFKVEKNKVITDSVSYNGKTYILLEYNMDIFTYYFNSNEYYEEDIIHPVTHKKWDMVYFNGDLFVRKDQVEESKKYYSDDKNYEWFIVFDEEETEVSLPISISEEELTYLYNMDNVEKNETMLFEEIKKFASITKISKDKVVYSLISLAYYNDSWYWKTEIIDVNQENDPEYVIKLPDSLNKKIIELSN